MRRSIPRHPGRSRLCVATVATGLLLTLPGLAPASAATEPVPVTEPAPAGEAASAANESAPARGDAYMGMGVMAHEGVGDPSDTSDTPDTPDTPDTVPPATRAGQTEGVDVSSHQRNVAWSTLWGKGTRWAYTKATEGTSYRNPYFKQQYGGAYGVGMVRGAYHFATPDSGSATAQADYFVDHGGDWSGDGRTLPGALDIEWNPYGDSCYGKSKSSMVSWIGGFLDRYRSRTGRDAVIYTSTSWWTKCTGGYTGFSRNPLWVARYASSAGTLPAGWSRYTMWQYTSTGPTVGDHDRFNGPLDNLREFAGN
ncbi:MULTISPECIES: lysozyme [unclassified Streptomyces]|uniref:lysozyme n=1 Tax=unclassified Streptomyces TaxID=2593676 RepID=UPI0037FC98CC